MNPQLLWLLVFLLLLLVLIVVTELLHKYMRLSTEQSRKFLHVSGGLLCLLFPTFFKSHWWLLPLSGIAFIILLFTYKRKMLASVHQTKRYSIGSVLFPVPVYLCFLAAEWQHNDLFFYLPVSLLTISDTAAEIGGNQWGHRGKKFFGGQKTLAGSICFFMTALVVSFTWLYLVYHWPVIDVTGIGLSIALLCTMAELVTLHGWDNLSVPAVAVTVLLLFH